LTADTNFTKSNVFYKFRLFLIVKLFFENAISAVKTLDLKSSKQIKLSFGWTRQKILAGTWQTHAGKIFSLEN